MYNHAQLYDLSSGNQRPKKIKGNERVPVDAGKVESTNLISDNINDSGRLTTNRNDDLNIKSVNWRDKIKKSSRFLSPAASDHDWSAASSRSVSPATSDHETEVKTQDTPVDSHLVGLDANGKLKVGIC